VNPAVLVTSARDVIRVVGAIGDATEDDQPTSSGGGADERSVRDELDGLDPLARRVFNGLPGRGAVDADQIAIRSGVQPGDVRRALPLLGLAGLVERRDGGYGVTRRVRDGRAKAPS
jgi:DNA processing protein